MGIYETLYAFWASFGTYMGDPGTHPWSQGFPRTVQLPDGPPMPTSVPVVPTDLMYPKAWGLPDLRETIATYYNTFYGSDITADNVMIFAGGRPALIATLLFLDPDIAVRIASTEYTPYYDMLERLGRDYTLVDSSEENNFAPSADGYTASPDGKRSFVMLSNPCNPTGITRTGGELEALIKATSGDQTGMLIDEAYELFHSPPVSAMQYIRNMDETNIFVTGATTKGFQAPGIRVGWMVASKKHVEVLGNFSSFGMGGVSHPSQRYAAALMEKSRAAQSRKAIPDFYDKQRARYGEAFAKLGIETFSGEGGFYHWCKLTNGMSSAEFNEKLFAEGAAILKGTDCDMARRGDASPLANFFRFSFGPLDPADFETHVDILQRVLS